MVWLISQPERNSEERNTSSPSYMFSISIVQRNLNILILSNALNTGEARDPREDSLSKCCTDS